MQGDKMVPIIAGKFMVVLLFMHFYQSTSATVDTSFTENQIYLPGSSNKSFGHMHVPLNDVVALGSKFTQGPYDRAAEEFTKRVLEKIAKRTSYANSKDEVKDDAETGFIMSKRTTNNEQHLGGCTATKVWIDLGSNYYPRVIRSYNCSQYCGQNYGECRAKTYTVKVLKKKDSSVTEEACDTNLPQELRCSWTLFPVQITTYCECVTSTFGR